MPSGSNPKMGLKRQSDGEEDATKPAVVPAPPPPKRQRVSRACDQCRAAREKCDGIQPLCFPCASQNRQCSWEEPKKKRGVQTGYIRTLELALGWIFDKIPGTEDALHSLLTHEGGQGRSLLLEKDANAGSRLHRRWRRSAVHKEIDRVLSGGDVGEMKVEGPSPAPDDSDHGGEDTTKPFIKGKSLPRPPQSAATSPEERRNPDASSIGLDEIMADAFDDRHSASVARNQRCAQTLKLPINYWRLLDIYFSYTHCWFPILDKALVQKTSWLYQTTDVDVSQFHPVSAAHSELWAALALASYQDAACQYGGNPSGSEGRLSPEELYWTARRLIPPENGLFEVQHINAILLLTLINIGQQKMEAAWILVGFACRISLSLGLSASAPEGTRRAHHAHMGIFILDTLISSQLDRPPHLRPEDLHLNVPTGEDDQDEWESWAPCPGFGSQQPQSMPLRIPSHSVSSFSSLFGIHKVLAQHMAATRSSAHTIDESYMVEVHRAISDHSLRRPFNAFITSGGAPPTQLPSVYLLRLTFLSIGAKLDAFTETLPATVIQCIEEHILNFGVCGIPPLFSTLMSLVSRGHHLERLTVKERDRWKNLEKIISSVWDQSPAVLASNSNMDMALPFLPFTRPIPNTEMAKGATQDPMHQLPTPASYYGDANPHQPPASNIGDIYPTTPAPHLMHPYANMQHHPRTRLHPLGQIDSNPSPGVNVGFEHLDMSQPHHASFSTHGRPSFSSSTFDYDAILDDIAAIDRTDGIETDPQFMANLGFAPGSNLADVLTHDFMGFSSS